MKKETSIALIVVGITLLLTSIVLDAIAQQDTVKKKYQYIYGIGTSPTLDGGYEIVYQELIDSVEITEIDTLSIK